MSHMIIRRIKLEKNGDIKIKWAVNNIRPLDWVDDIISSEWVNPRTGKKITALEWLAEGIRTEFELRKGLSHSKLGRACLKLNNERPLWREEQHPKIVINGKLTLDYDLYFVQKDHPLVKAGEEYNKERAEELDRLDRERFLFKLKEFMKEEK